MSTHQLLLAIVQNTVALLIIIGRFGGLLWQINGGELTDTLEGLQARGVVVER
jgi:hypothetical protein